MTAKDAALRALIGHHPDLNVAAPAVTYRFLPDGDGGTFITLDAMRDAVLGRIPPDFSGYQDEFNIRAANNICASAPGPAKAQTAALFHWVARNIQYEPHPINQQTLQDARRTLELKRGDCVSLSVLLATLLACLGYESQFIAQWVDDDSASHVYVEVFLPDGEMIALDAVAKDQPAGWRQKTLNGGFELPWRIFE